jgi:hypothetical protein
MKRSLILMLLLLYEVPAMAQDLEFAWDLSPDDALLGASGGYHLYSSKQSGSYMGAPVLTVPPGTTTGSIPRPGLGRYHFVATAFDSEGNESAYSNEVTTVIKPKPPTLITVTQAVLAAPARAISRVASLFRGERQLRIVRQ